MSNADMDDLDKAMADALLCGTGIMKFSFVDGQLDCHHVPVQNFLQLSEELKSRHAATVEVAKQ